MYWMSSSLPFVVGFADGISHSLCKLLVSLGDHSTQYLAANLATAASVANSSKTKADLVQNFLKLLLAYTSMPGYYGSDEEESEMTLGFWYLFQEALWSVDYNFGDEGGDDDESPSFRPTVTEDEETEKERQQMLVARAVYSELVQVLRRKVVWPPYPLVNGWTKGSPVRLWALLTLKANDVIIIQRSTRQISSVSFDIWVLKNGY